MNISWTFGKKIAAGFFVVVAIAIVIAVVSITTLTNVVQEKDRLISIYTENLVNAQKLETAIERKSSANRGYLLTTADVFVEAGKQARNEFIEILQVLKSGSESSESRQLLNEMQQAESDHQKESERVLGLRRTGSSPEDVENTFEREVYPKRERLTRVIQDFVNREKSLLDQAKGSSEKRVQYAVRFLTGLGIGAALLAAIVAFVLTRTLTRQLGSAVHHVQNSSSELQAAANQQATGTKEQSTSMSEISTTISELLATSKQIAESAQRVAHIASETAQAAVSGDQTVLKAQESIGGIRRQVDVIVNHMLDLGKKSQQIGGILEIINELAEQTNILAINASVEAVGAGDAGRRFGVVADEIRKLADRVGGSTKEIRNLVEEVRAAVNTTVMATEGGAKAVDSGTRQFAEVATSFQRIGGLVGTTTEAAREIELSTKQQSTAVEQVNVAILNIAQATKETEASSNQTLQTAVQLATLSKDLSRLIQTGSVQNHHR